MEDTNLLNILKKALETKDIKDLFTFLQSPNLNTITTKEEIDNALRLIINSINTYKNDELIDIFLRKSDLNFRNETQSLTTIPMIIHQLKEVDIYEKIILLGFDPSLTDIIGNSFLHHLINSEFKESQISFILKKLYFSDRIKLNIENKQGETELGLSLKLGFSKISEELISYGSDIRHVNVNGFTNLHYAVLGKNPSCVLQLTDLIVDQKNNEGESPLGISKKLGLEQINKILNNFPSLSKKEYMTPLEYYKKGNYKAAVKMLENPSDYFAYTNDNQWNIFLCQLKIDMNNINIDSRPIYDKLNEYFSDESKIPQINTIYNYNKAIFYYQQGKYSQFVLYMREALKTSTSRLLNINMNIILFDYFCYFKLIVEASDCLKEVKRQLSEILNMNKNQNLNGNRQGQGQDIINDDLILSPKISLNKENSSNSSLEISQSEDKDKEKEKEKEKDLLLCKFVNCDETIKYLESIGYISCPDEEANTLINLYYTIYSQITNNYQKAKILLKEFKRSIISSGKLKKLLVNHFSFIYTCIKLRNDYYSSFSKFYSDIIKLYDSFEGSIIFGHKTKALYNNKVGIINLKLKNFSLSEFHFKACLQILNSTKNSTSQLTWLRDIVSVKYNLGLSYFYQKEYYNAYILFKEIEPYVHINVYFNYRVGVTCLEYYRECFLIDEYQLSPEFRGYNEFSISKIDIRRLVLKGNLELKANSEGKKYIKEAICHFKQSLILLRGYGYDFELNVKDICLNYDSLLISSYLNLVFSLILVENYREALYYISEMEMLEIIKENHQILIENYKVKLHLNLGNYSIVLELIKKMLNNATMGKFYIT